MGAQVRLIHGECSTWWKGLDGGAGGSGVRAAGVELGPAGSNFSTRIPEGCLVELFRGQKRIIYKWTLCISCYSAR